MSKCYSKNKPKGIHFKFDFFNDSPFIHYCFCLSTRSIENASLSDDSRAAIERKKYEDEIARLRGENELLKAILIKHGINYVKERTTFKSNEYS